MNALEAATRARLFTGKPDGEVVILKNQTQPENAESQHPVVSRPHRVANAGYKGEQFDAGGFGGDAAQVVPANAAIQRYLGARVEVLQHRRAGG